MTSTYIDFHLLQTVPPSCVNRDDTGSPKSAMYGGSRRARVSSQAWKRATRHRFKDELDEQDLGVRTKRVVEMVASRLRENSAVDGETAEALAAAVVQAAGLQLAKARKSERQDTEFLVLVSRQQAVALAELAAAAYVEAGDVAAATKSLGEPDAKRQAKAVLGQGNSVDLALFGRMVANDTDLNVDASCQVAHAISVHAADSEFDYFTAVDDLKVRAGDGEQGDAGASMIGTVEFTSATLYRYASINVNALAHNLGDDEMTRRAIRAFASSFIRSMPTGKANTFANFTLPEAVVVSIRSDQPVSYVGAFEGPVEADGGYMVPAAAALCDWAKGTVAMYGVAPLHTWVAGMGQVGAVISELGETSSVAALPDLVASAAIERLAEQA